MRKPMVILVVKLFLNSNIQRKYHSDTVFIAKAIFVPVTVLATICKNKESECGVMLLLSF